ncbi:hypothetical protein [Dyadobacter sp. CY351]|nr:hypothetical protein [Dyadobacter sp. CY351]
MRAFMAYASTLFLFSLISSCNDKFYKEKYDVEMLFTNKTDSTIAEIKIDGANGAKVWTFKNVQQGKTEKIIFNIMRELKVPEGGFMLTASLNDTDSIYLNTGYFTNWSYQGPIPAKFNIYKNRIDEVK